MDNRQNECEQVESAVVGGTVHPRRNEEGEQEEFVAVTYRLRGNIEMIV